MSSVRRKLGRDIARAISWHRRLLAAALAAACVALILHAIEPRTAPTTRVLAAARDLPSGVRLQRSDLRTLALPRDAVPAGALRRGDEAVTRVLASPVRAGETLTDVRLLGPTMLASYGDDVVAAPVRVSDPTVLGLVRVGDRLDVLAAYTDATEAALPARTLVSAARVLALPGQSHGGDDSDAGLTGNVVGRSSSIGLGAVAADDSGTGLVLLAVSPHVAADLARAAVTDRLSVVLRGDP